MYGGTKKKYSHTEAMEILKNRKQSRHPAPKSREIHEDPYSFDWMLNIHVPFSFSWAALSASLLFFNFSLNVFTEFLSCLPSFIMLSQLEHLFELFSSLAKISFSSSSSGNSCSICSSASDCWSTVGISFVSAQAFLGDGDSSSPRFLFAACGSETLLGPASRSSPSTLCSTSSKVWKFRKPGHWIWIKICVRHR